MVGLLVLVGGFGVSPSAIRGEALIVVLTVVMAALAKQLGAELTVNAAAQDPAAILRSLPSAVSRALSDLEIALVHPHSSNQ